MKIVIDIPEERYEFIKGLDNTCYDIHTAIAQGIPLPKGHGDLIDRDVAYEEFDKAGLSWEGGLLKSKSIIPTVIPRDK